MAITLEKFVEVTNAEEVAGNVIIGIMGSRQIVGTMEAGVFSLNDAGKAIAEQIEAGTYGKNPEPVAQPVEAPKKGKKAVDAEAA